MHYPAEAVTAGCGFAGPGTLARGLPTRSGGTTNAITCHGGEDGSCHVEADLPGAGPDSTEVTVEHGVLTIRAARTPHYGDSEQVIAAERPASGVVIRQLTLGESADSENLTASYADGVLHVTIPTSPKAQARRVEVTRAAGGSRVVPGSTVEPGEAPADPGRSGMRRMRSDRSPASMGPLVCLTPAR